MGISRFEPFLVSALLALAVCGALIALLHAHRQARKLQQLLNQKSILVEETAKMLVEKNIELSDQNVRLERSLEAKNDFIGVASHQLRTPITEIKWSIEDLLDETHGVLTEQQKTRVGNLLESATKMTRLIDELLHFVESEAGFRTYTIAPTDIEKLTGSLLDEAAKRFSEKNIRLERSFAFGNKPLSVDAGMIAIAIGNLIDNAFHYTPPGGTIRVSTTRDEKLFVCTIADSGIGIPEKEHQDVFKKFRRSRGALAMHSSGVGLGLYITKNIITQHSGGITFESTLGKGTTFRVTLPSEPVSE